MRRQITDSDEVAGATAEGAGEDDRNFGAHAPLGGTFFGLRSLQNRWLYWAV